MVVTWWIVAFLRCDREDGFVHGRVIPEDVYYPHRNTFTVILGHILSPNTAGKLPPIHSNNAEDKRLRLWPCLITANLKPVC